MILIVSSAQLHQFLQLENGWLRNGRRVGFWLLLILAFYAAVLRRDPVSPDTYFFWPAQKLIRSFREDTFWRLSWYWQPWGLAASCVGIAALMLWLRKAWQVAFWALGLVFLIGLTYDIRNNPIQPYAMRRFFPFATPLLTAGAAVCGRYLADRIPTKPDRRRLMRTIAQVGLSALLLVGFIPVNRVLNRQGEFPGVHSQIAELAGKLPQNAVVLTNEATLLSWLATPLQFIFEKDALTLAPHVFTDSAFQSLVRQWREQGRSVYLLTESPGVRWIEGSDSQVLNPTNYGAIRTSYLFQSATERPKNFVAFNLPYYLIPLDTW
jgi:hypothetical protein